MDEPCSALDPKGTEAVEELIWELRGDYTILIVTHNMAQARRASAECIFMLMGKVIEHAPTEKLFVTPAQQGNCGLYRGTLRLTPQAPFRQPFPAVNRDTLTPRTDSTIGLYSTTRGAVDPRRVP